MENTNKADVVVTTWICPKCNLAVPQPSPAPCPGDNTRGIAPSPNPDDPNGHVWVPYNGAIPGFPPFYIIKNVNITDVNNNNTGTIQVQMFVPPPPPQLP